MAGALHTLAARILSRPLDMSRPPWEAYLIHGLDRLDGAPPGCVGLLFKNHHCAVDGASGVEMALALADLAPEMAAVPPPQAPWRPDRAPSDGELLLRTWGNSMLRPMQFGELLARSVSRSPSLPSALRQDLPAQTPAPRTRFNAPVTPHRVVGMERFPLDEVRAVKNEVTGATVNDVALTIGALRKYLEAKIELPEDSLLAMAPISVRKPTAEYGQGNAVSAMFVAIGTHLEDPVQRLQQVRDATAAAKQMANALGADTMLRYNEFVPAAVSNLAQRLTTEFARANQAAPAFNCSITNVPGPQVPLYTMGLPHGDHHRLRPRHPQHGPHHAHRQLLRGVHHQFHLLPGNDPGPGLFHGLHPRRLCGDAQRRLGGGRRDRPSQGGGHRQELRPHGRGGAGRSAGGADQGFGSLVVMNFAVPNNQSPVAAADLHLEER